MTQNTPKTSKYAEAVLTLIPNICAEINSAEGAEAEEIAKHWGVICEAVKLADALERGLTERGMDVPEEFAKILEENFWDVLA